MFKIKILPSSLSLPRFLQFALIQLNRAALVKQDVWCECVCVWCLCVSMCVCVSVYL